MSACAMRFLPTLLAQGKRALSQSNVGVHLTESCVKRLHQLQNERSKEVYLRVAVDGGGCSGFQYSFALEESACDDDRCVYQSCLLFLNSTESIPHNLRFRKGAAHDTGLMTL